ncbi:MAG: hypothetical protein JXQ99_05695 [Hyphomicrobiaceae bacterium]
MLIAQGRFEGRQTHEMRGTFTIVETSDGLLFETSDDFFFDGSPEPAFALSRYPDPDQGQAGEDLDTRFLDLPGTGNLTDPSIEVRGKQTGIIGPASALNGKESVFLWCYLTPFLLGVGRIERV